MPTAIDGLDDTGSERRVMSDQGGVLLSPWQQKAWRSYVQLYQRLEYELNRMLQSGNGVSLGDYAVMNALASAEGHRLHAARLAADIGWEPSRLSHHLKRMIKQSLVIRIRGTSRGRSVEIVLTPYGYELCTQAAQHHGSSVRRLFFADLDDSQGEQLAELLSIICGTVMREGTLRMPGPPGRPARSG